MPLKSRQGITLIDLLLALVVTALLGIAISRLLVGQRRGATALQARDDARRTMDQTAAWITSELIEVGKGDSAPDLLRIAPESVTYRAWRMGGITCLVSGTEVRIRRDHLSSWRTLQPGRDSLMLLASDDSLPGRDRWVAAGIATVGESDCGGRAALRIQTSLDSAVLAGLPPLVPVRGFEVMQLRLYSSGGEWWLGARSVSAGEGIQPLAGPFASAGLRLSYWDSAGVETTQPEEVQRLRLSLTPQGYLDSAQLFLGPRNLP